MWTIIHNRWRFEIDCVRLQSCLSGNPIFRKTHLKSNKNVTNSILKRNLKEKLHKYETRKLKKWTCFIFVCFMFANFFFFKCHFRKWFSHVFCSCIWVIILVASFQIWFGIRNCHIYLVKFGFIWTIKLIVSKSMRYIVQMNKDLHKPERYPLQ